MSGAGEEHQIRHDVVMIGNDGAAFEVAQSQGVGTPSKDLGVAAAQDEGLADLGHGQIALSLVLF